MGIAPIAVARGVARGAVTVLAFVSGFAEPFGGFSPQEQEEVDGMIAQAREALRNDGFDAAWSQGSGSSLGQAVELSLTVTASPAADPDPT